MAAFVEVRVLATGRTEQVPAEWVGHPVLGVGIEEVEAGAVEPVAQPAPEPPSDVQLSGPVDDLPVYPAVREAVLAERQAAAEKAAKKAPTKPKGGTESPEETPANGDKE